MTVYDFSVEKLDGEFIDLNQYRGQVLLIVNVATFCGRSFFEVRTGLYQSIKLTLNNTRISPPCCLKTQTSKSLHFLATNFIFKNPAKITRY